jgi:hypothetical protein
MNRLSKSLVLVLVGTAGALAGRYLGPQELKEPVDVSAALPGPALAKPPVQPRPRAIANASSQAAEMLALRAELQALQAQVARQAASSRAEPARREEVKRKEKARVFDTQLIEAENKFREEPTDPARSRQSSEALNRLLDKYPALRELGAEVECRSASCRISLAAGAGEGSEETLTAFINDAQADFGQIDVFPGGAGAGVGQTVLHLSPGFPPDPDLEPGLQPKIAMITTHSR